MDKDAKESGTPIPVTGLLWVALVAVGAFAVHEAPWRGSRPVVAASTSYTARQDVDARLWQDPLTAVSRGRVEIRKRYATTGPQESDDHAPSRLGAEIRAKTRVNLTKRPDAPVAVFAVMVQGGSFAESVESRRRARYATLAAFSEAGIAPEDSAHVGYIVPGAPSSSRGPRLPEFIAYEWLNSEKGDSPVLVLWLDEYVFSTGTVALIESVKKQLATRAKDEAPSPSDPSSSSLSPLIVIGPVYSSTLQAMARTPVDVASADDDTVATFTTDRLPFYSYGATADDAHLFDRAGPIPTTLDDKPVRVFRTITNDGALGNALRDELASRGIDPRKSLNCDEPTTKAGATQHIVLISERDTLYGRSLPTLVARSLNGGCWEDFPWFIHRYSYLRGLDGQLPTFESARTPSATSETARIDGDEAVDRTGGRTQIERPDGEGQFDYLRRLSGQLHALNDELRAKGKGSIKAVGVLGSDVFDKLIVLQALQPEMPGVIFFTTDLDARMLHPKEQDWTRNLIVASSFGLALRPELQRDILPFRDDLQTAVYFSMLIALHNTRHRCFADGGHDDRCITQDRIDTWLAKPRIFEIGRTAPFDLSGTRASTPCGDAAIATCADIHPVAGKVIGSSPGEPFSWIEGISVWPSEILRALAALMSIGFIFWAWHLLTRNLREISEKLRFEPTYQDMLTIVRTESGQWPGVKRFLRSFSFRLSEYRGGIPSPSVDLSWSAQIFWKKYIHQGRFGARFARVVFAMACYFALSFAVIWWFGMPNTPYRGSASFAWNIVALSASVSTMLFVIFFVVDATVFCYQIVKALQRDVLGEKPAVPGVDTRWAGSTIRFYTEKFGLEPRYVDSRILMDFIALRTDVVAKLVYFPFIVIGLMILSRNRWFDNWTMPIGLVVVLASSAVIIVVCAWLLRRAAEGARTAILEGLEDDLIRLKGEEGAALRSAGAAGKAVARRSTAQQIEAMIASIRANRTGAFAPYSQQPIVKAVLLSLTALGGPSILEYITTTGF